jgi:hypothetical protein
MLIFLNSTKAILILSWALNFWNARVFVGRFFTLLLLLLGSTCVCPSSETLSFHFSFPQGRESEEEGSHGRRRRESSHGAPLIYGVYPFSGDIDCCAGLSVRRGVRLVRASEKGREWERFFLEGQPNDPKGSRFPIRIRAQFTAGHKIIRKLRLNP